MPPLSQASGLAKQQKHTEHLSVRFSVIQVSLLFLATSPCGLTLCMQQRTMWLGTVRDPDKGAGLSCLGREGLLQPSWSGGDQEEHTVLGTCAEQPSKLDAAFAPGRSREQPHYAQALK